MPSVRLLVGDESTLTARPENGEYLNVTVDNYLPTDNYGYLVYASQGNLASSATNELWVALAEKAYAQLNEANWIGQDGTNSYAGIEGGWMSDVYNQVLGTAASMTTSFTQATIVNALNAGKAVTIGTETSTSSGFVSTHAYIVTSYDAARGTFNLHNPWGSQHLTGVTFTTLRANASHVAIGARA